MRDPSLNKIAEYLRAKATQYPDWADIYADQAHFYVEGVTIRCKPTSEAILAVAAKYAKGSPFPVVNRRTGCREQKSWSISGAALKKFRYQCRLDGDVYFE